MDGITEEKAGPLLRFLYRLVRNGTEKIAGKAALPASTTLAAHQPRVLAGQLGMELAQGGMSDLPMQWKALASVAASSRIGCPF